MREPTWRKSTAHRDVLQNWLTRLTSFLAHDFVITVGPTHNLRTFVIPKQIIKNKSSLLYLAANGELSTGTIDGMDEIRLKDFNLYLNWLDSGKILTADCGHYEWRTLFRLYSLSYTLLEPGFRNDIVDTIAISFNSKIVIPSVNDVNWVYQNTGPSDKIRGLFVEMYAKRASVEHIETWRKQLPAEFLGDLLCKMMRASTGRGMLEEKDIAPLKSEASNERPQKRQRTD